MTSRWKSRRSWLVLAICGIAGLMAVAFLVLPASAARSHPDAWTVTLWGQGEGLDLSETRACPTGYSAQGMRVTYEVWETNGNLVAHAKGVQEFYDQNENGEFSDACTGEPVTWQMFSDNGVAFKPGLATEYGMTCFGPVDLTKPEGSRVTCEEGGGGLGWLNVVKG